MKFTANVLIEVEADHEAEACDAISACLTEVLMGAGAIVDWHYVKVGDKFIGPQPGAVEYGELKD